MSTIHPRRSEKDMRAYLRSRLLEFAEEMDGDMQDLFRETAGAIRRANHLEMVSAIMGTITSASKPRERPLVTEDQSRSYNDFMVSFQSEAGQIDCAALHEEFDGSSEEILRRTEPCLAEVPQHYSSALAILLGLGLLLQFEFTLKASGESIQGYMANMLRSSFKSEAEFFNLEAQRYARIQAMAKDPSSALGGLPDIDREIIDLFARAYQSDHGGLVARLSGEFLSSESASQDELKSKGGQREEILQFLGPSPGTPNGRNDKVIEIMLLFSNLRLLLTLEIPPERLAGLASDIKQAFFMVATSLGRSAKQCPRCVARQAEMN